MVVISDVKTFLQKLCNHKHNNYVTRDLSQHCEGTTATIDELMKMVLALESDQCTSCGCQMLFENYQAHCLYQYSFDKLRTEMSHSIDNLRIICFHCNASCCDGSFKKSCNERCHITDEHSSSSSSSSSSFELKEKPARHNTKWTIDDDNKMFDMIINGELLYNVASALQRIPRSIDKRLHRLLKDIRIAEKDLRFKNDLHYYFYDQTGRERGVWSDEEDVLDTMECWEKKTLFQAYNHEEKEASRKIFKKASNAFFGGQGQPLILSFLKVK